MVHIQRSILPTFDAASASVFISFFGLVGLFLVCIMTVLFKDPLVRWLPALKQVEYDKLKLTLGDSQTQASQPSDPFKITAKSEAPPVLVPVIQEKYENALEEYLSRLPSGIDKDVAMRQLLLEQAAMLDFGKIYIYIYGSQIQFLDNINALPLGASLKRIEQEFHDILMVKYPDYYTADSFHVWLHYLIEAELVEEKDGNVVLTEYGRAFLVFLTAQGLPKQRPH